VKAIRLSELKALLEGEAFVSWWTEYGRAVQAVAEADSRQDDLAGQGAQMEVRSEAAQRAAMDAFADAGDAEDDEAKATAEAQAEENRAMALVARYEEQRLRTSGLWYRLGGAERTVEERREAFAGAADSDGVRSRAEAAVQHAERLFQQLRQDYAVEDAKRSRLWEDVEAAWARSFERALVAAEHGQRSRKVRRDSERLFKEAEERRARVRQLQAEAPLAAQALSDAERRRRALLGAAEERFGCAAGDGFLYWRHPEDKRAAWAVALADDHDLVEADVRALSIHAVGRRGIAFLEPAREGVNGADREATPDDGARPPAPRGTIS
jgi:hypothetical protein